MLKFILNKNIYELPLDESYKEKLNIYSDVISVDDLSDVRTYKILNKLFLCVSQALVALEENNCPKELQTERNVIFRNIMPICEHQKQRAQKGFYSESNKILTDFLEVMLKHYERYIDKQKSMHL